VPTPRSGEIELRHPVPSPPAANSNWQTWCRSANGKSYPAPATGSQPLIYYLGTFARPARMFAGVDAGMVGSEADCLGAR
jgi:hypothetical protein